MYEDKRIIEPTGLLSQAKQPAYQPKPIKMTFNAANKPAADHVNLDKDKEWQRNYQEESLALQKKQFRMQQQQMANSGGDGGGMSVICTRYHELGFLPDDIYRADSEFGLRMLREQPALVLWYWSWAIPLARRWLHGKTLWSRILTAVVWPWCRAWAVEMAYRQGVVKRGSILGRVMMKTSLWVFRKRSVSNTGG